MNDEKEKKSQWERRGKTNEDGLARVGAVEAEVAVAEEAPAHQHSRPTDDLASKLCTFIQSISQSVHQSVSVLQVKSSKIKYCPSFINSLVTCLSHLPGVVRPWAPGRFPGSETSKWASTEGSN
jgi:hypothetical protein